MPRAPCPSARRRRSRLTGRPSSIPPFATAGLRLFAEHQPPPPQTFFFSLSGHGRCSCSVEKQIAMRARRIEIHFVPRICARIGNTREARSWSISVESRRTGAARPGPPSRSRRCLTFSPICRRSGACEVGECPPQERHHLDENWGAQLGQPAVKYLPERVLMQERHAAAAQEARRPGGTFGRRIHRRQR